MNIMNQFIPFIIKHWVLWVALVAVIVLLVMEETRKNVKGVRKISPQEVVNLMNHESAKVIDVRSAEEFAKGHLTDAMSIPIADLEKNLNKLNKFKTKPIILVCNTGQASLKAGLTLTQQGFAQVYAIDGGITGWLKSGLPLTKN